jgi:hypothetical protein
MKNLKVPAFSSERFCKYKEQLPEIKLKNDRALFYCLFREQRTLVASFLIPQLVNTP